MAFTITSGAYSAVLPSPKWGDTRQISNNDIRRRTVKGDLKVYASSDWAVLVIHNYQFTVVPNVTGNLIINNLKALLSNRAGELVTIVNHLSKSYTGIIPTPVTEIISMRPGCSYDVSFDFLENTI